MGFLRGLKSLPASEQNWLGYLSIIRRTVAHNSVTEVESLENRSAGSAPCCFLKSPFFKLNAFSLNMLLKIKSIFS